VYNAPIDVILTPHDVVQPDLVVVTDLRTVSGRGIEASPTLIVEVLSPSTATRDRGRRRVAMRRSVSCISGCSSLMRAGLSATASTARSTD
jgi:hypothetical protein